MLNSPLKHIKAYTVPMRLSIILSLFFCLQISQSQEIDIQGHRGSRGLLPENTIPAFLRAIDEGVTTLELDVVITKDKRVVVSHEPYMSSSICTKPDGTPVTKEESRKSNIYQMTYAEVEKFDCGSRGNVRFPEQQKMKVSKPLLKDLIISVEKYVRENNLPKPKYNIEIKSSEKGDEIYHPGVVEFSTLVHTLVTNLLPKESFTIQSFDFRVLKHWHTAFPEISLVALIENSRGVEANLGQLGFIPEVYSPYHILLNRKSVKLCHKKGMKVVPWTVNKRRVMKKLIKMGVDGIITDYPNRAKGL